MDKKKLVIGVIGADVHAVGNTILQHAFEDAGFEVTNLGVMVSQEEYISAAIETAADAILVSSLYGHGELDCRGLRDKCDEAGLKGILLYVGGNIVVGKQPFNEVEKRFKPWALTGYLVPELLQRLPLPLYMKTLACRNQKKKHKQGGEENETNPVGGFWKYQYKGNGCGCGRIQSPGYSHCLYHSRNRH